MSDRINLPHAYNDSFGNECCERLECGRDWDDPIHIDRYDRMKNVAAFLRSCALSGEIPTPEAEFRAATGVEVQG
jgi:hypothetical protein